ILHFSNLISKIFKFDFFHNIVLRLCVRYRPSNSTNSYCTESKECLQFDLLCRTKEYEVRHYSPTRWVSTDAEAYFMGVGAAMAFRRLYQYITGANERGVEIEMTAPVMIKVPEQTQMWGPALYTLSFLLPSAFQHNPPAPTNDKLYFTDMPETDVYVWSYGGWMLSITSRLHAHLLTKELNRVGANYNHTHHYAVGYDSPLKLLNRHNEVWYLVEEEPVVDPDPTNQLFSLTSGLIHNVLHFCINQTKKKSI
uniref:Heme-binding protein 1 n=1 Tax=Astyanax mexicanus TaxID=7994 RepID=A0A8B9HWM8_ASTMX